MIFLLIPTAWIALNLLAVALCLTSRLEDPAKMATAAHSTHAHTRRANSGPPRRARMRSRMLRAHDRRTSPTCADATQNSHLPRPSSGSRD